MARMASFRESARACAWERKRERERERERETCASAGAAGEVAVAEQAAALVRWCGRGEILGFGMRARA